MPDEKVVDLGQMRAGKLKEELMKEARKPKPWQKRIELPQKNIRFRGLLLGPPGEESSMLAIAACETEGQQRVVANIKMTKAQWRMLINEAQGFLELK